MDVGFGNDGPLTLQTASVNISCGNISSSKKLEDFGPRDSPFLKDFLCKKNSKNEKIGRSPEVYVDNEDNLTIYFKIAGIANRPL